jgi:transcriptional regulator with XRE-family HTH domain
MVNERQPLSPPHRLREIRQQRGLTQAQLGEKVGRTATEISRFERGERDLYLNDLRVLGEALGTDAGGLLNPADNRSQFDERQLEAMRLILNDPANADSLLAMAGQSLHRADADLAFPN